MIDFLILYEVAVRELEGVTLLGNELINRGYSVEYLSFTKVAINKYANYHRFLKKFFNKVRVVLMPSLYHDTGPLSKVPGLPVLSPL